eukprot:scpid104801/ scgid22477/ 
MIANVTALLATPPTVVEENYVSRLELHHRLTFDTHYNPSALSLCIDFVVPYDPEVLFPVTFIVTLGSSTLSQSLLNSQFQRPPRLLILSNQLQAGILLLQA